MEAARRHLYGGAVDLAGSRSERPRAWCLLRLQGTAAPLSLPDDTAFGRWQGGESGTDARRWPRARGLRRQAVYRSGAGRRYAYRAWHRLSVARARHRRRENFPRCRVAAVHRSLAGSARRRRSCRAGRWRHRPGRRHDPRAPSTRRLRSRPARLRRPGRRYGSARSPAHSGRPAQPVTARYGLWVNRWILALRQPWVSKATNCAWVSFGR